MTFNSLTYLIFLPIVLLIYWSASSRIRPLLICIISLSFYSLWKPVFVLVMLLSASVDYFVGLRLEVTTDMSKRKMLLGLSLAANLGLLAYFKYLFFIVDNIQIIFNLFGQSLQIPHQEIILPLGISFYTFEAISYVVDCYRRVIKAERNIISYFGFITFFPKLIAGPILRAAQLIPQFYSARNINSTDIVTGLQAIFLGLCLKGLLADNISPLVDDGFARPISDWSAWDSWTMAFLFGYQIYFDFAAYSYIAIGSSRMMGIILPDNFKYPYSATSPREFWKRWHISLSAWIRDYLYLPLMGEKFENRIDVIKSAVEVGNSSNTRSPFAIIVLFMSWSIMGLWHGANWTFVLWGVMHASFITIYRMSEPIRVRFSKGFRSSLGLILTLPAMMLAWIPFRAANVGDALTILEKIIDPYAYSSLGLRENTYLVAAVLTILVLIAEPLSRLQDRIVNRSYIFSKIIFFVSAFFIVPLALIFLRPITQFIYFQF
jgi:alginate O-acetyltransferase complex protein AlgI